MSKVWFIGDPHFGHKNIGNYRADIGLDTQQKNEEAICDEWVQLIKKRDIVYVLGDAAFTEEAVNLYNKLPAQKKLVIGNHDCLPTTSYLLAFRQVLGTVSYKRFWLSHCPVHPLELRRKPNIHAHVHNSPVAWPGMQEMQDSRYVNCACDYLFKTTGSFFKSFEEIKRNFSIFKKEDGYYL